MTFSPTMLSAMKAAAAPHLARLAEADAKAAEALAQAALASETQSKLHARLAEIDREMEQPFIPPDAKRVERLLAGETPATLDAEEVQARARRNGLLVAERAQLIADAEAVGQVHEARRAEHGRWSDDATKHKASLVHDVMNAAADAYAEAMTRFVGDHVQHIPWLMAVHHEVTGRDHPRLGYNLNGLQVSVWPRAAGNYKPLWPSHSMPEMVRIAGRGGNNLDNLIGLLSE